MGFITIEGGEGSGKTTLISALKQALQSQGKKVLTTREPGGSPLGEYIRQWLLERDRGITVGSKAELLLFLAARAQHIEEVIQPALLQGTTVLCDRFNDSTVAYQGRARGLGEDFVQNLCDVVCGACIPETTLYLDIDPRVGLERSTRVHKAEAGVGQKDRIESEAMAFHDSVRQAFLVLAEKYPQRIHVIDATLPPEQVLHQALALMRNMK